MQFIDVMKLIRTERTRQDLKWGREMNPNDGSIMWPSDQTVKLTVLTEEVGEIARAILDEDRANQRDEIIQVAAVCVAWLESDFIG